MRRGYEWVDLALLVLADAYGKLFDACDPLTHRTT
jgi:hypothetical protein